MVQPYVSNKELGAIIFILCSCIDIRFVYKFYLACLGAARRTLQLQHCYVVWHRRNKYVPWNKKGQLRTTGWPVATEIKAIDPNLPLLREKETNKDILII